LKTINFRVRAISSGGSSLRRGDEVRMKLGKEYLMLVRLNYDIFPSFF
jgi:hypothetical protein